MRRAISGALAGLGAAWLIARYRDDLELAVAAGVFVALTVWFWAWQRPAPAVGGREC
ncbi:hypothetical protein ACPCSE_29480 [Streptomyces cellulosae]